MATLTQLEYIVAVDDHRHFGHAAKAKNVSQPSLSQQIQKAEEELGVVIFDRTSKPIRTTDRGRQILQQARLILNEHQRLLELSAQKEGKLSGILKLGVIPTVSPYLIPLFLKDFAETYPKIELEVFELQTENIIRQLFEEKIDAAILATPLGEKTLTEWPLYYEPFMVYHSPKHPAFKKAQVSHSDLKNQSAWVLSEGHCFGEQMKSYCALSKNSGVLKNVQFQSGSFETLQNLVDDSESYTLFPKLFADRIAKHGKSDQLKKFKNPAPSREISLVFKRKVWKQDLLEALRESIFTHLPKDLPRDSKKNEVLEIRSI